MRERMAYNLEISEELHCATDDDYVRFISLGACESFADPYGT